LLKLGKNLYSSMVTKQLQGKGILAKVLEQGIKILLKKECRQIGKIKIDIEASSIQIIKGIIEKIDIAAKEINYKDLFFDEIELEANKVKINLKIYNKELKFENDPEIKLKISLSENSMKKILSSKNWNWISHKINKDILNQAQLEDIKIKNEQILIKSKTYKNEIPKEEKFNIKAENGKIYLNTNSYNKSIHIPIEDKVYVKDVIIRNNLIIVFASSSVSF
tara:strand:- start:118 stop:783 length:666 start_codon:yes stop_codon:yes gene_type:complete